MQQQPSVFLFMKMHQQLCYYILKHYCICIFASVFSFYCVIRCYNLSLVVERYVIHAEVGLQALKVAVGRVHGTAAAVTAQSHGVGDHGIHTARTVRKLKGLVVKVPIRAHMLVHFAVRYLDDGVRERERETR